MNRYKIDNYISSYFDKVISRTPEMEAYNLGVAVGMFQLYRHIKVVNSEEMAMECFEPLMNNNDQYSEILRTLIGLENESDSEIEKIVDTLNSRKENIKLTKDEIDIVNQLMKFKYKQN